MAWDGKGWNETGRRRRITRWRRTLCSSKVSRVLDDVRDGAGWSAGEGGGRRGGGLFRL